MITKLTVVSGLLLLSVTLVCGQTLTNVEQEYLKKKAFDIAVDSTYRNGNWEPVLKRIKNKRIVLLGEFNHGSKEVFVLRNDLIKSLHENAGFDVVMFESGIGELAAIDLHKEELTTAQMTYGFFGGWRTKEFRGLMGYIKANKMSAAGFDVQRTGGSFGKLFETEAKKRNINPAYYTNLRERFTDVNRQLVNRKALFDFVERPTRALIKDYETIESLLKGDRSQPKDNIVLLVQKTISNRIAYLKYRLDFVKDKDWNRRWRARDLAMADNIDWLIENFYKNKKIIVIAHNFHISKFNKKEEVMGEFLKKKYGSKMYSLATYADKGSYHANSGNKVEMKAADSKHLDIKHVIRTLNGKVNFINVPKKHGKSRNWFFNEIIINDSFTDLSSSNKLILSKHFDGLLLIDKVSPPEK